jgi:hypothetical protein
MWTRQSLQTALLGSPAGGDARQIVLGANHIDKRQLEVCRAELKTEYRKTNRPEGAPFRSIRSLFFDLR